MKKNSSALIQDRAAIIAKLSELVEHERQIEVPLGELGTLFTVIIDVDSQEGSMLLRCSEDEALNKKIVTSPSVEFAAEFGYVQVSFTGKGIKKITHEGVTVFLLDIPTALTWLNRRRHDRRKIPVLHSSFCEFVFPKPNDNSTEKYKKNHHTIAEKLHRLSLYDVSFSGCSMLNDNEKLSDFFEPQMIFENCKIVTPDNNEIRIAFEVMAKRRMESEEGQFSELIGIKFVDIKHKLIRNF